MGTREYDNAKNTHAYGKVLSRRFMIGILREEGLMSPEEHPTVSVRANMYAMINLPALIASIARAYIPHARPAIETDSKSVDGQRLRYDGKDSISTLHTA